MTEITDQDTYGYPRILQQLLELVANTDQTLAYEAAVVLKMFLERECVRGDAVWLEGVESFLDLQQILRDATGAKSLRNLTISIPQREIFAFEVMRRIEVGTSNGWLHAYVLKQAACVAGLQDRAMSYLQEGWKTDESVTLHLLYLIWAAENWSLFRPTLIDIFENAQATDLREHAKQNLRSIDEMEKR